MSVKTLADLKARFETGDMPAAQDFIDFLDSFLHAGLGNFPDPLPAVSGADLEDIGDALPDPLPARDGSALTNINPKEYNVPGSMPVPSYATADTFVLSGDFTVSAADVNNRVFLIGRRLRIQIADAYEYTEVSAAVFAAGITTVTTLDAMSGSPIQEVAVGVITPFGLGGAVGATVAGAVSLLKDDIIGGNKKFIGPNTFQERVNAANSTGGTANAITAAFNPIITALVDKMRVVVRATAANTGATTFDPGTGAVLVEKVENGILAALVAGDITGSFHDLDLVWNAGNGRWLLLNPSLKTALGVYPSSLFFETTLASPMVEATAYSANHGLGSIPKLLQLVMKCLTTELGYAVGDEVQISANSNNLNNFGGLSCWASSTQVGATTHASGYIHSITHKTNGAPGNAQTGNWALIIRAWK